MGALVAPANTAAIPTNAKAPELATYDGNS